MVAWRLFEPVETAARMKSVCAFLIQVFSFLLSLPHSTTHFLWHQLAINEMDDSNAPLPNPDLRLISHIGITVDQHCRIHDNVGNPVGRSDTGKRRMPFSADDDETLKEWVQKAEDQGLHANSKIFEDLESIVRPLSYSITYSRI